MKWRQLMALIAFGWPSFDLNSHLSDRLPSIYPYPLFSPLSLFLSLSLFLFRFLCFFNPPPSLFFSFYYLPSRTLSTTLYCFLSLVPFRHHFLVSSNILSLLLLLSRSILIPLTLFRIPVHNQNNNYPTNE